MNVYPSIDEILPDSMRNVVPANLVEEIDFRYRTLGEKYVTNYQHKDGRFVNACMYNSSIQDAIEEVVDAVFNTLVWIFKTNGNVPSQWDILQGLTMVYSLLKMELQKEEINGIPA